MTKQLIISYYIIFAFCNTYAMPVIINDTGKWSGEIQAKEEGFLVYNVGMWTQNGANFHSGETILTFADDFSPVIANEGINHVTCTYDQVGWIWPYGGPTLEETITFKTSKQITETSAKLGGAWKNLATESKYQETVPLLNGQTQTINYPSQSVSFTTTQKATGLSNSIAVGAWALGTAVAVAGSCSVIGAMPATIAGIAIGTLGTILGFVVPTETTTLMATVQTNACAVSSGNRLKLFTGLRARAYYYNIKLYPDVNLDGLADTTEPVDATIDFNEDVGHFATLVADDPSSND